MRYCTECGTPLQSGVTICPQCGKFVPLTSQASTDANSMMPVQYGQSQQRAQPSPSTAASHTASSVPPPSSPVAGYYGAWQNSAVQQQVPPYFSPPPRTPPLNKAGIGKGGTISLSILAVLIMFSGVMLIYYSTMARPTQLRAQATATVQTILTAQTQATSSAQAQTSATVTAQAQVHATATALQNTYARATSGDPALTSSLVAEDNANWDTYSAVGGGGCAFVGNAFHASTPQSHSYVPCFAQASNFSNFAFQVQMTVLKGDGGGLVFRADDINQKFYLLRVSQDGAFGITVSRDSKNNSPILDDTSTAIKTGAQTNLITIIARGSAISIYINKQFADTINDSTYSSGKIGVFAFDTTKGTDVAFNNATLWTL